MRQAAATKNILLDDDESDSGTDMPAATLKKAGTVVLLQTDAGGYNSGRAYRLRTATARDSALLAEDLGRLAAAARAKLQRKSWLTGMQVPPPLPLLYHSPFPSTPPQKIPSPQTKIQPVFASNTFQKFVALLIVSVGRTPPPASLICI